MNNAITANDNAYAASYSKFNKIVKRTIAGYNLDYQTSQDLEQDAMIKIWKYFDKIQTCSSQAAWVTTVTKNLCRDYLRAVKPQCSVEDTSAQYTSKVKAFRIHQTLPTDGKEYEKAVASVPEIIAKHKNEVRREVALRFYVDGDKITTICETLNLKQNTVTTHLRRFRNSVRQSFLDSEIGQAFQAGPAVTNLSPAAIYA